MVERCFISLFKESDFAPFFPSANWPSVSSNVPNQEAELLKLGHQLLQNAASKADAKRRSFHQQKVLHATSQLRGMSRWVDDISGGIYAVWTIFNWDCFGIYTPLDCLLQTDVTGFWWLDCQTSFLSKVASWGPHPEDWGHLDLWSDGEAQDLHDWTCFSRDFQVMRRALWKKNASVNGPVDIPGVKMDTWSRCGRTIQPSRRLEQTLEFAPVSFLVLYLHEHVFLAKKMIRRPKKVSYLDTWASPCVFAVKVIQPCNT